MPEHIHLLLKPRRAQYDLAKFEQAFKLASSRRVIFSLLKSDETLLEDVGAQGTDLITASDRWHPK